jgi:hypothetical protein
MKGRGTQSGLAALLVGAGAAIMLIVLLVVQSLIGGGLFSTRTVTVTVTSSDAYEQVSDAFAYHLMQLNDRNISAVAGEYQSNATAEWTGVNPGLNGNYSGAGNIKILWGSFIGKFNSNFSLSNEYQSVGEVKGSNAWMVNSTFNFDGYDAAVGNVSGTVVAQDLYGHVGDTWLIAREIWNFTRYDVPPLG